MTPLPFVWPYWPPFWAVGIWAFLPESRIIRKARQPAARSDSPDAGSVGVIVFGGGIATLIAFPLAWVPALRVPAALDLAVFAIGARPDQPIITTGAYALLRHPSYTAGILMNVGMGLALGSWASALLLALAAFAVYSYRIAVEERTLLAIVGESYREFMRTRRRLIPFIY